MTNYTPALHLANLIIANRNRARKERRSGADLIRGRDSSRDHRDIITADTVARNRALIDETERRGPTRSGAFCDSCSILVRRPDRTRLSGDFRARAAEFFPRGNRDFRAIKPAAALRAGTRGSISFRGASANARKSSLLTQLTPSDDWRRRRRATRSERSRELPREEVDLINIALIKGGSFPVSLLFALFVIHGFAARSLVRSLLAP